MPRCYQSNKFVNNSTVQDLQISAPFFFIHLSFRCSAGLLKSMPVCCGGIICGLLSVVFRWFSTVKI